MKNLMVYFYGTDDGKLIKAGKTEGSLASRRSGLEQGQLTAQPKLHLLAAVRAIAPSCETAIVGRNGKGGYFDHLRETSASSKEIFRAEPELVEYIHWLRQQPWTWHGEVNGPDAIPEFEEWRPNAKRRIRIEEPELDLWGDPISYDVGELGGTPWWRLSMPAQKHNDYYTPPHIIREAREAMGGIDLDAASHWKANEIHGIPNYYHANRSAFHNPWYGKVWLNPPYGNNGAWFGEVVRYLKSGDIEQICIFTMINPLVARTARGLFEFDPSLLLFNPTPTFWGSDKNGDPVSPDRCETSDGKRLDSGTGTDQAHGILYIGPRKKEFATVFGHRGPIFFSACSGIESKR